MGPVIIIIIIIIIINFYIALNTNVSKRFTNILLVKNKVFVLKGLGISASDSETKSWI